MLPYFWWICVLTMGSTLVPNVCSEPRKKISVSAGIWWKRWFLKPLPKRKSLLKRLNKKTKSSAPGCLSGRRFFPTAPHVNHINKYCFWMNLTAGIMWHKIFLCPDKPDWMSLEHFIMWGVGLNGQKSLSSFRHSVPQTRQAAFLPTLSLKGRHPLVRPFVFVLRYAQDLWYSFELR